jgi:Stage II sporulation protein E (SpoIIE)
MASVRLAMGRLRSALRAYALDHNDPADVLYRLDRKLCHFESDITATVVYVVTEPPFDLVTICNAGHPAPLIAQRGQPFADIATGSAGRHSAVGSSLPSSARLANCPRSREGSSTTAAAPTCCPNRRNAPAQQGQSDKCRSTYLGWGPRLLPVSDSAGHGEARDVTASGLVVALFGSDVIGAPVQSGAVGDRLPHGIYRMFTCLPRERPRWARRASFGSADDCTCVLCCGRPGWSLVMLFPLSGVAPAPDVEINTRPRTPRAQRYRESRAREE